MSKGPPPFAFAFESAAFEKRWREEIPVRFLRLQKKLIPERNILKYQHGANWTVGHKTRVGEFKEHREEMLISDVDRQNAEIEILNAVAEKFAQKMEQTSATEMFKTMAETTQSSDDTLNWDKKKRNAPVIFLKLLRCSKFSVDDQGKLSQPTFFNADPDFLAELISYKESNPSFEEEVEEIKKVKTAEAFAEETKRKAKFRSKT